MTPGCWFFSCEFLDTLLVVDCFGHAKHVGALGRLCSHAWESDGACCAEFYRFGEYVCDRRQSVTV